MAGKLQHEIGKVLPFDSREEEAALSLMKTADVLNTAAAEALKPAGLSPTQYNVLRILRGAGAALACREIGERMIARDPDMTRLLDRLEKRGLIARCRDDKDRRVVHTRITDTGRQLIDGLDQVMADLNKRLLGHLGPDKLGQLTDLLDEVRAGAAERA